MSHKFSYGRNDLCPCGSGKKYKKCCLNIYGTHGSHTLLCYLKSYQVLDKEAEQVTFYERHSNRKVSFLLGDYQVRRHIAHLRARMIDDPILCAELTNPEGKITVALSGAIPHWDKEEIILDPSITWKPVQLGYINAGSTVKDENRETSA